MALQIRKRIRHFPANDGKLLWTNHALRKMAFYRLSEGRIKRVLRNPKRSELGVAPGTIALMQPERLSKKPSEVWLMYQRVGKKKRIITAWRYPGKSPVRDAIPIPSDILEELESGGFS